MNGDTNERRHLELAAPLTIRPATMVDVEALRRLAERSVYALLAAHYSPEQLAAGQDAKFYWVEPELIEDGTYYVLEIDQQLVACSGWSHRGTFHPPGTSDNHEHTVDSETATMRATYVDPRYGRRGFATLLARVTELAATNAGYRTFEAMCTPPSEAMRRSLGYEVVNRIQTPVLDDVTWAAALMRKTI
ncbi:hypothetical protein OG474_00205 [Kribbella sp. NBC_01505]|uniref:GNAT family N-acetyltransferase n=1 Tax=Kribbella sp. NBC_01505 TaxID=2903580 RepID=UPI003869B14D